MTPSTSPSTVGRSRSLPAPPSSRRRARLGLAIPTLCHVEGFEPSASCFLCAVKIEGRPNLWPSCATPAAEGMVVITDSDEVRAARKTSLELLLSDHAGDCVGPCQTGLPRPAGHPQLHRAHRRRRPSQGGRDRDRRSHAARFAGAGLPAAVRAALPAMRRGGGALDPQPASVHAPTSSGGRGRPRQPAGGTPAPLDCRRRGKRVAIVGAGPAGLAAAHHLLRRGHGAVLFDAHPQPGGMLRYGIPAFRLPRQVLDAEIQMIRELGAEFRLGKRLGRDFTLDDLRREFDAVFLAIGAQGSRGLGCPGEELATPALEFLEKLTDGPPPTSGSDVVIVGGGNTAMDASRCAVRLGAKSVRVLYRRTRREMPCLMEEVEAAEAEGVQIEFLVAPVRLERQGGEAEPHLPAHGTGAAAMKAGAPGRCRSPARSSRCRPRASLRPSGRAWS